MLWFLLRCDRCGQERRRGRSTRTRRKKEEEEEGGGGGGGGGETGEEVGQQVFEEILGLLDADVGTVGAVDAPRLLQQELLRRIIVSKLAIFFFFFFGSFSAAAVAPGVVGDGYYCPLLFIR